MTRYRRRSRTHRAPWWGWLAMLCAPVAFSIGLTREERTYIETTGNETSHFSWILEQGHDVIITVREEDQLYINHCDSAGITFQWQYQGTDSDILASRTGDSIEVKGRFEGKAFHTRHEVDSVPWYQTLAYALPRRVDAENTTLLFWTIRPDNLQVIKMRATWEGPERVAVNGDTLRAHRVRIRPDGLRSRFWHADYWFRVPDGLFVRYEGVHGLPGHPKTVIQYRGTEQAEQVSPGRSIRPGHS